MMSSEGESRYRQLWEARVQQALEHAGMISPATLIGEGSLPWWGFPHCSLPWGSWMNMPMEAMATQQAGTPASSQLLRESYLQSATRSVCPENAKHVSLLNFNLALSLKLH